MGRDGFMGNRKEIEREQRGGEREYLYSVVWCGVGEQRQVSEGYMRRGEAQRERERVGSGFYRVFCEARHLNSDGSRN